MKKSVLLFVSLLLTAALVEAQNPPASPRVSAEGPNVKIEYGQPSKRGRVLFGPQGSEALEKYGKVWRIGANRGTEITFSKDGRFGGEKVSAGSYTMFAIPGEKDWTIILNSVLEQPGTGQYEKNKEKDVLRITVPKKQYKNSEEKLTFKVGKSSLDFQWDNVGFSVPTKF